MNDLVDAADIHLGGFQPLGTGPFHSRRTPSCIIWRAKLLPVSTNFRCIEINIAVFCRLAPGVGVEENHHLWVQGRQGVPDPRLQLVRKLDRVRRHACILSAAGIPRQARTAGRSDGRRVLCPWRGPPSASLKAGSGLARVGDDVLVAFEDKGKGSPTQNGALGSPKMPSPRRESASKPAGNSGGFAQDGCRSWSRRRLFSYGAMKRVRSSGGIGNGVRAANSS
jgi:hypothetical protein